MLAAHPGKTTHPRSLSHPVYFGERNAGTQRLILSKTRSPGGDCGVGVSGSHRCVQVAAHLKWCLLAPVAFFSVSSFGLSGRAFFFILFSFFLFLPFYVF